MSPAEESSLPFDISQHKRELESIGTIVKLPDKGTDEAQVIKISKEEVPYCSDPIELLKKVVFERKKERLATEIASDTTKTAIVPQEYAIVEGVNAGYTSFARAQKYHDGITLKELGFREIVNLEEPELEQLRTILVDSMRSYLKTGRNYDLFGSGGQDVRHLSQFSKLVKCCFPLRNSHNLLLTADGIKFIDPSVLSKTEGKQKNSTRALQFLTFLSSVANYVILSLKMQFVK